MRCSLSNQFADQHPDWSSANHYSLGLLTSALFFVSIVLHELGHSLVAIRFGIPAGYEFTTLVEDIVDVSRGDPALDQAILDKLAKVDRPVHMQVFVSPS